MVNYLILILFWFSYPFATANKSTLLQVHVLFRHGERNPVRVHLYPKDPHINDTWLPNGYEALTNNGKMQIYNIGTKLRERYDKFLGEIYHPDIINARSTNTERTKMSMALALAGLWPPASEQTWNKVLNWQPIPFHYVPMENDEVMILKYPLFCKNYEEEYNSVVKLKKFRTFLIKNQNILDYIEENTGQNYTTIISLHGLYDTFISEETTGRILPEWTKKVYPNFMEKVSNLYYSILTYNNKMIRIGAGPFIRNIIAEARKKMTEPTSKNSKIFLYAAHDYNIAFALAGLKVFKSHMPPYGSYIIVELHKINQNFWFKIFYQDYKQKQPKAMIIPGCEKICPFEKFLKLLEKNILADNEVPCT